MHLRTTFAYVYGFCVRLCTAFTQVVQIFRTYTTYFLHKLCGLCVRIHLLCALIEFGYVYNLSFALFDADSLKGSDLVGSKISFFCANARDLWTVSGIRS